MDFPLVVQTFSLQQVPVELYVPEATAVRKAYEKGTIPFPYWSRVWPAAKALALFLLQQQHYTNAKTVVELGAGLGLPSLIAARKATHVLCTDIIPEAVAVVKKTVSYLNLKNITADVLDWCCLPQDLETDVLLLSDINYEPATFPSLEQVIAAFLQKETTIILSTPQRLMARDFLAPLLASCTQQEEIEVIHEGESVKITVVVLQRKGRE